MAIVVVVSNVAVDFILTVGTHLGISWLADALGISTNHVGSHAVVGGDAGSWWQGGSCNVRLVVGRRFDTGGNTVSKKISVAHTFVATNSVGAGCIWVAWIRGTFVLVNAFDRAKDNRNVWLTRELIWKEWSVASLANALVPEWRIHVDTGGTTRTWRHGRALINVNVALLSFVSKNASAGA